MQEIILCCWPRTNCPKATIDKNKRLIIVEEHDQKLEFIPEQIEMLSELSKKAFGGEND